MSAVVAIARRELAAELRTPAGWVVAALFVLFTNLVFFVISPALGGAGFRPGQPASLAVWFEAATWALFVVAPATTMRGIAEEVRSGTIETLMTAPVREEQIVLGKFLGAFAFLALLLASVLVPVIAVEWHGRPDYGEIGAGVLGLLLAGACLAASGVLGSAATASQALAFLGTVFGWVLLLLAVIGLPAAASWVEVQAAGDAGAGLRVLAGALDAAGRLAVQANPAAAVRGLLGGLIDGAAVVLLLGLTAVFLLAASRLLRIRRTT